MNLNKNIAAFAVAAILLSMNGFNSEAETIVSKDYKKNNNLKVVKIPSKRHHLHDKFIGGNRYETSSKILEHYKNKKTLILVDASDNMSDGLSAAALSGKLNANIVPINPDNLDEASKRMIDGAKEVFLIGGYNAIPKEFEKSLSGKKIIRIGGKDRIETSQNIANYIGNYKKAYIVNGYTGQADAMSIAPVSARDISPIILTKRNKIEINNEKNVDYTVIGGKDAVSNNVQNNTLSNRIGGKDRYETNRMILDKFYKNRKSISFCNGETLVDALSGTYFARNEGIALVNNKENLHLLENINTNQLGGLPMDIKFVVPETIVNAGRKPIIADNHKSEENKEKEHKKIENNKDKNIDKDKKEDIEKNKEKTTTKEHKQEAEKSDTLISGEKFDKEIKRLDGFDKVKKIVFTKETPTNLNSIDYIKADENGKGDIIAYIKDNTIYIASKNKIYANSNSKDFMMDMENIKEIDLSNLDTSKVEDMSFMFKGCSNLEKIELGKLDTSNVKNMRSLFEGCRKLENIDLSKFNTSKVVDMGSMFASCNNLKCLDLSRLDTSNVEDMSGMFLECNKIPELDLSKLNTSNVKTMSYMFGDCYALTKLNINNFDTSKVEDMMAMFTNCINLNEINLTEIETDNVTNTSYMLSGCLNLTKLDLSNFNTSKVEYMSYMFASCDKLKNIDLENLETGNVVDMSGMFKGCNNINATINIEGKVEDFSNMFEFCSTKEGAKLIVNYKNEDLKQTVENMIKTKSEFSNVEIGSLVE